MNIFTDASITKTVYGETIGCAGAICKENMSLFKTEILRDSTNNISEITAIRLAVELALELGLQEVNIWSDSQWSIFGLTKWFGSWYKNMNNFMLMNSSGEEVKNQEIFLTVIRMIVKNNLKVNFYHIKGHVNLNDNKSIINAVNVFKKSNGISISREEIYHMIKMNILIDDSTRKLLSSFKDATPVTLNRGMVNPVISKEEVKKYYSLITLGGNRLC